MNDAAVRPTPLLALHEDLGAKLVPFAGYLLPLSYPAGILREHAHVRSQAGLFDVSHMGQVRVTGADPARALERLVPADVIGLARGRLRYTVLTNARGGVRDDLVIARAGEALDLVVNAATSAADLRYLTEALAGECVVTLREDRALLALQGPAAAAVLARLAAERLPPAFMSAAEVTLGGVSCTVARAGYTGEDGFEIALAAEDAERLARRLLAEPEVAPAGLGARDSLRLEAGLCLYGHDLDETTTPVEAAIEHAVGRARRRGGTREGGFPGAEIILDQLEAGAPRGRVGLGPQGRAPVRAGATLVAGDGTIAGRVTSGSFAPTLGAPAAMGYVQAQFAAPGTQLAARVRGREHPVIVVALPFVEHRYRRGGQPT